MDHLPQDSLAFSLLQAARTITSVLAGESLAGGSLARVPESIRPAVQDHVYACLRQFGLGDFLLARLLDRPLVDVEVRALLLVALARLEQRPESTHTVVDQAVAASGYLAGGRCRALANAVLRAYLRQRQVLLGMAAADDVAANQHPGWWIERLRSAFPDNWLAIVSAGNTPPPMALRVNRRNTTREDWLATMTASGLTGKAMGENGVLLDRPVPVERLPGFAEGRVSVQDLGAQRAAMLLAPAANSRVLDACAAPGGKTAHLLENTDLDLLALDLKAARCRRIEANLQRLGLSATIRVADCRQLEVWWDGQAFDAVLADVPCTASGVVRRHPDVKWLRRESDIAAFAATQSEILDALWQVVRSGGKLQYATCSLFPEENGQQIGHFLARTPDARRRLEEQWLPDAQHDGFYYCLLEKTD